MEAMTETYRSLLSSEQPGVFRFGGARMALLDVKDGSRGLRRQMEALVGRQLTDTVLQQAGANGGAPFARSFVGQAGDAQALRDCIGAYQAAGFGQFEVEGLEWPFGCGQDRVIGHVLIRAHEAFEAWTMQQHGQSSESPVCAYSAGVLVGFVNVLAGRHDVVCIERACQAQGAESWLTLHHSQPGHFTARHADLVLAFANQVAVAIENARLYARAEESAVAAERNRLARDLHDAVTQILFSSSLIAEVLPCIWERDPEEGRRRLQELRELTWGALAEMRTLLLKLRPSALVEARLADLLRQLAESITGRARVPVHLEVEGECKVDAEVKVALYRIAQEALNDVAKHAGASEATVHPRCQPGQVELCVRDDGLGFDQARLPPDNLGLDIMRERAEAIGAQLEIESQARQGTEVRVVWAAGDGW
jgi:signal transduction histidine kinase